MKAKIWRFLTILFIVSISRPTRVRSDYEDVQISKTKLAGDVVMLSATNPNYCPMFLTLRFPVMENMDTSQTIPVEKLLPALQSIRDLIRLTPRPGVPSSYSYSFLAVPGDPRNVRHNDRVTYWIPYQHGTKHRVTQGYNGTFSHQGSMAIDFGMPIGTMITAARDGIVTNVKEDSNIGGPDVAYRDYGNFVEIYHDDETFAVYMHLKHKAAFVEPGRVIKAGDTIGLSGDTGYADSPHLHFEVKTRERNGASITIPTKFYDHRGVPVELVSPQYYYGYHPGKAGFQAEFGRELNNERFNNADESIRPTGEMRIEKREVDEAVIFYGCNGTGKEQDLTLTLQGENFRPSRPCPFSARIPSATRRFLLFIVPVEPDQPWKYSFQYQVKSP